MTDFYNQALKNFGSDYSTAIIPTSINQNYITVVDANRRKIRKRSTYNVIAQNRRLMVNSVTIKRVSIS